MYEYKVIIDRWVDGDTVDVDIDLGFDVILKKQRVRLHGIDAVSYTHLTLPTILLV